MNSKMSLYRTMIFVFLCDSDCPITVITHTNRFFPILLFLVRSKEVSVFFPLSADFKNLIWQVAQIGEQES